MRIISLILLLGGLFLNLSIQAQTPEALTCITAFNKTINNNCAYTNHKVASNQNEYWIQFTATNTTIELITAVNGTQPLFNAVHLLNGDCSNPQILATDSSYIVGDTLNFSNALVAGQTYFLLFDISSNFAGDFDACIVKSVTSGSITIVNNHGDSVICTYDTNNNSPYLNCPEITLCVGESLCFSAIDFEPSNEIMNMLVAAVYGNVGTITNNSDSTIACVNFPTVGSQTIFVFPYDSPIQYDLTQSGGWPYNNYFDPITGDSVGNISWYFNVNVVDQTPPATTNSDGLLCFGDQYTITAYAGSIITSVTVDNQIVYTPNSSTWSTSFTSVGQHVIAYTVDGFCYPVTYYDTVNVIQDNALTVTVDACNNATFTFTSCEEFTQIDLLFSNGVQEQVFSFNGTTSWSYNFSGITTPLTWTFNGYQPNPFFPFQPIITYTQTGTIQPVSVQPLTISAPLFLCEMTPNAITITSPTGLTNIVWNVSPSTGITGQGTSSITLNTIPSSADVIINVSATDANGCKYAGTVTIENCCQPIITNNEYFERTYVANGLNNIVNQLPAGYYNGPSTPISINLANPGTLQYSTSYAAPTNLTQFLAANPAIVIGGNVITNNWIFINNDLYIDQNVTFTSCNFIRIAPGAKIILMPGMTLTASRSTFAPKCDEMWGGFETSDPSQTINLSDVNVIGAEYGINSSKGGVYHVFQSRFVDNLYGIYVHSNPFNPTISTVKNTYFGDVVGQTLLAPYQNEPQPLSGILVLDIQDVVIGTTDGNRGNLFHNHQRGISSNRASVHSFKNNFYNIRHASGYPAPNEGDKFAAIFAMNSITFQGLVNHTLYANGVNTSPSSNTSNNFINCEYGISARNGMNLEARNNYMKNCVLRGVSAEDNRQKLLNVYSNIINSTNPNAWGIYLKSYGNGFANVYLNSINTNNNTLTATRFAAGIYVSSVTPSVQQTTVIQRNTVQNCLYGIWMINTTGGSIKGNTININLTNAQINSLASTVAPIRGIVVQNSQTAQVWNNTINRNQGTGNGVSNDNLQAIRLEVSPSSYIWKNIMNRTAIGLYALGSNLGSKVECNSMNFNRNGLWMQAADISNQGSAPIVGFPNGISAHNAWSSNFSDNSDGTTINHGASFPLNYYHTDAPIFYSQPDPSLILTFWADIALAENPSTTCGAVLNTEPIVLQNAIQNRTREMEAIVNGNQLYDSLDLEMKHYLKHSALSRLKQNPNLVTMNAPDDILYQNYLVQMDTSEIATSYYIQDKLAQDQFDSVNIALNQFNTLDSKMLLIKQVENIWNTSKLTETPINPTDSLILYDIACSDPLSSGSAVYQARAILDWDGLCLNQSQKLMFEQSHDNLQEKIETIVFPNPSNGAFIIESNHVIHLIEIHDLHGLKLYEETLLNKNTKMNVSLKTGVYFVKLFFENGFFETHKITIL